jgi:HipA-like protein
MSAFRVMLGALCVGVLQADRGEWVFTYTGEFRQQDKISPIVNFPVLDREYRSRTLWPFFALRIPSLKQPALQEFLQKQPSATADEGILLREFGMRSIANPFRLVPV